MNFYLDALDGIVGYEEELDVQPVAFQIEPEAELQPDRVPGQTLESAGGNRMSEVERQPESEPEAIDAITIPNPEIQSEAEPEPRPKSTAFKEAGAITVPNTAPGPEPLAESTEADSMPDSDPQSATPLDDDSAAEPRLTEEINILWNQHKVLNGTRKATATELRQIKSVLAKKLYEMKQLLSRPGRSGEWRGWLKQQGIARSSADRWVSRYAESLTNESGNVLTGAINDGGDKVEQLVQSLLPRLKRTLPDTQSVFKFIAAVGEGFGLGSEITEDCIMLSQPKADQNEPAAAADASEAELLEVNFSNADAPSSEPIYTVAVQV